MSKPLSLLDMALRGAQISRHGLLTMTMFGGEGAVISTTLEFNAHQRWAAGRISSGNKLRDRSALFDRFEALVARPGSFVPTRGSAKVLAEVAKLMKEAGFETREWQLPDELKGLPAAPEKKPAPEDEERDDEADS